MDIGFNYSPQEIMDMGARLVTHIRSKLPDTTLRSDWTKVNLDVLKSFSFFSEPEVSCYPAGEGKDRRPEFLYDFIAYSQAKGILLAAESEWLNRNISEIKHDFEKLLYVRSPLKLMMCRVESEAGADEIRNELYSYMHECCAEYSPGELFIIYCVQWKGDKDQRGDFAFGLQVDGEPMHRSLRTESFQRMVWADTE